MFRHDSCAFWLSGLEYPVLPGISEIGYDQGYGLCSQTPYGVLKKEHFDHVSVGIGVLYDYNIVIQFFVVYSGITFAVRKTGGCSLYVSALKNGGQLFGQVP